MSAFSDAREREASIKAAVRERDGYRCRDCGISEEEHVKATGKGLHVHRVFPGSAYRTDLCATLCESCHGSKPRRMDHAFWASNPSRTGLFFCVWSLYDPDDRALHAALQCAAERRGMSVGHLVDKVLWAFCEEQPGDYCI
jgi:hypothetical protein